MDIKTPAFRCLSTFRMKSYVVLCLSVLAVAVSTANVPCVPRNFDHGSVVCVCNATYCDSLEPLGELGPDEFFHVVTSKAGLRFSTSTGTVTKHVTAPSDVLINIDRSVTFQKIIGFGGSFTDAAGINIASVSKPLQKAIIDAYYGKDGLEYNIGRVNMGSCDFSSRLYSYDDVENDTELKHFALATEDTDLKIPYVLEALKLNPNVKMFASPWTAPKWMKTNNEYYGAGVLKTEYYQPWANYFVRFLEEYAKRDVNFWAVTTQNEPIDGLIPNFNFNCMGWTAEMQRDWIKNNLGPTLSSSKFNSTKILMLDDQRAWIVSYARTILRDPEAAKYISGIGLHWYMDFLSPSPLDTTHNEFPDYFMFGTEACTGSIPGEHPVLLGSWERGQRYAADIIEDLNHWVTGWTDWNLALDLNGGPNWAGNTVDAPIIVDNVTDVAYKQPMYYALGHFSKYIPENSVRISAISDDFKNLQVLAVQRPDKTIAVVLLNMESTSVTVALQDSVKGVIEVTIDPHSLSTIAF